MPNFPTIKSEDDLEIYNYYLEHNDEPTPKKENINIIGKNARVEFMFGNRKEIRCGKIIDFNPNYIILKPIKSKNTLYCDAKRVLFITVIN